MATPDVQRVKRTSSQLVLYLSKLLEMKWTADETGRLDHFLVRMLPHHSRSKITKHLAKHGAVVNGVKTTKAGTSVQAGSEVITTDIEESAPHELTPVEMDLDIRYEDDDLLVVNKPRGLAVHPAPHSAEPTLVHGLLGRKVSLSSGTESFRPGIVHRLDKHTTGLVIVAKNDFAHAQLAANIKERKTKRRYLAIVRGAPEHDRFIVDAPLGKDPKSALRRAVVADGKPALTHFKKLKRLDAGTLLAARLETGRTHQIRVHLSHFRLPVLGDELYGKAPFNNGPMQLHAAFLEFVHPRSGEVVIVYAEGPPDFLGVGDYRSELENW